MNINDMNNLVKITANGTDFKVGNPLKFTWDETSNMNDFKTPGVYEIYGERTVKTDNLPITNDGGGHSFAANLTVVASTLQPNNTEKCITQFLQLSNRIGGEGNTYIRTYNENNNGLNGWSEWKKQQGMVESYINTDTVGITATGGQTTGLNSMTENGIYSGIYTDDYTLQAPTFVETFVLIVINDYAVSSQAGTPRRISQLKYATDTITGQCTVKKRVGTGGDSISWGDWEDIGGGGSQKVDITDAIITYGLPTLVTQGLAKEGVTYVMNVSSLSVLQGKLDTSDKIYSKLNSVKGGMDSEYKLFIKVIGNRIVIDVYEDNGGNELAYINYYKFIMTKDYQDVKVSADMATL